MLRFQRGTVFLELAAVLSVGLFLVFATIDIASLLRTQSLLREGLKSSLRCITPTDGACVQVTSGQAPSPGALFDVWKRTRLETPLETYNYRGNLQYLNQPTHDVDIFARILSQVNYERIAPHFEARLMEWQGRMNIPYILLSRTFPNVSYPAALGSVRFQYPTFSRGADHTLAMNRTLTDAGVGSVTRAAFSFTVPEITFNRFVANTPEWSYDCLVSPTAGTSAGGVLPSNLYAAENRCAHLWGNANYTNFRTTYWNGDPIPGNPQSSIPTNLRHHIENAYVVLWVTGSLTVQESEGYARLALRNTSSGAVMPLTGQWISGAGCSPHCGGSRRENFEVRGHFDTFAAHRYLIRVPRGVRHELIVEVERTAGSEPFQYTFEDAHIFYTRFRRETEREFRCADWHQLSAFSGEPSQYESLCGDTLHQGIPVATQVPTTDSELSLTPDQGSARVAAGSTPIRLCTDTTSGALGMLAQLSVQTMDYQLTPVANRSCGVSQNGVQFIQQQQASCPAGNFGVPTGTNLNTPNCPACLERCPLPAAENGGINEALGWSDTTQHLGTKSDWRQPNCGTALPPSLAAIGEESSYGQYEQVWTSITESTTSPLGTESLPVAEYRAEHPEFNCFSTSEVTFDDDRELYPYTPEPSYFIGWHPEIEGDVAQVLRNQAALSAAFPQNVPGLYFTPSWTTETRTVTSYSTQPLGHSCAPQSTCGALARNEECIASFLRWENSCGSGSRTTTVANPQYASAETLFYETLGTATRYAARSDCTNGDARCASVQFIPAPDGRSVTARARYNVPLLSLLNQHTIPVHATVSDSFERTALQ